MSISQPQSGSLIQQRQLICKIVHNGLQIRRNICHGVEKPLLANKQQEAHLSLSDCKCETSYRSLFKTLLTKCTTVFTQQTVGLLDSSLSLSPDPTPKNLNDIGLLIQLLHCTCRYFKYVSHKKWSQINVNMDANNAVSSVQLYPNSSIFTRTTTLVTSDNVIRQTNLWSNQW